MKSLLISNPIKLIASAIALATIASGGIAQGPSDRIELSMLGNLVRNNAKGDYKFPGAYSFKRSGSRAYINHFARKLSQNDDEIAQYEDVLQQGIRVWEEQSGPLGYTNDLAGGLAFYTVVNHGLAKNYAYKDGMLGNLVAQYRKAFCSKLIASMPVAKKQDMYDYMITESVFLQALASSGRERSQTEVAEMISKISNMQIQNTFGTDASNLEITENGIIFK